MAEIKAFRGTLYNLKKVGTISSVVAPPYDVISTKMQRDLYRSHPNNVVRLILGKKRKADSAKNSPYTRARAFMNDWINKGILVRDDKESIYVYGQDYTANGARRSRIGFIALMKLEDFSGKKVLPHEQVFSGPKKDRFRLTKTVKANLSPIFSLYQDDGRVIHRTLIRHITRNAPYADATIGGIRHRLWNIRDTALIASIRRSMRTKKVFIADGHHRYSVALAYRDSIASSGGGAGTEYVMMYFSGMDAKELTILPTHRMARNMGGLGPRRAEILLARHFSVKKFKNRNALFATLEKLKKGAHHAFGLYMDKEYSLLILKSERSLASMRVRGASRQWKQLDVSILHHLILRQTLKVDDTEENIRYTRDALEAVNAVDRRLCRAAFFLNPTKISRVKAIAQSGELMPHKSTYFYPKLLTGLVMRTL
ncbi:MAG: DUF1015 domain-containing protein [Candidatus Omnitrophota bacterium]